MSNLIQNEGDVIGSEQYGIRSGTVGDNSTVNQSISRTTNTQYNYHDEHNSYLHSDEHNTSVYMDSHNTTTTVSNSSVSNSYTSVDSHDTYSSTSYDSHDVTNINASFTSTGQAAMFGLFFGHAEIALALVTILAMAVIYFINTILAIMDVVAVALLISLIGYVAIKHQQGNSQNKAYEAQREAIRADIAAQRAHELELAKLSRPVYLTVRNEHGYSIEEASPALLEDNYSMPIEFGSERVGVHVRRQNTRSR